MTFKTIHTAYGLTAMAQATVLGGCAMIGWLTLVS